MVGSIHEVHSGPVAKNPACALGGIICLPGRATEPSNSQYCRVEVVIFGGRYSRGERKRRYQDRHHRACHWPPLGLCLAIALNDFRIVSPVCSASNSWAAARNFSFCESLA